MGRGGKGGKRGPGVGIGDRPKKLRAPKQGKRGVVNESGEQGFHNDNGDWIATGWFDAEGYWYEAAGENDARGQWVATGAYDVYDPEVRCSVPCGPIRACAASSSGSSRRACVCCMGTERRAVRRGGRASGRRAATSTRARSGSRPTATTTRWGG